MEDYEIRHIENHPELAKITWYRTTLLSILKRDQVLDDEDIQLITSEKEQRGNISAMTKFYDIMKTKRNSFEPLKNALEEGRQTGALDILNRLLPSPPLTPINILLHESQQQPVTNPRPIQAVVATPQRMQVKNQYNRADSDGSAGTNDTEGTHPGYDLR